MTREFKAYHCRPDASRPPYLMSVLAFFGATDPHVVADENSPCFGVPSPEPGAHDSRSPSYVTPGNCLIAPGTPLFSKCQFAIGRVAGVTAKVSERYAQERPMRFRIPRRAPVRVSAMRLLSDSATWSANSSVRGSSHRRGLRRKRSMLTWHAAGR